MSKNLLRNLLPRNFRFIGTDVLEDLFISKEPPPAGSVFQYVHVPLEHYFMPRHGEAVWKKFIMGLDESKPWLIPSSADFPGTTKPVDLPDVNALPPAARVYAAYKQNSALVFQILPTDSIGQPWAELATWEAKHGEIGFLAVGWNGYADRYGNLSAESTITSCHLHNFKDERLTYTDYRKHKIVEKTELVERTEPRELPAWQTVSVSSELYEQSLLWHEEDVRERLAEERRAAERAERKAEEKQPIDFQPTKLEAVAIATMQETLKEDLAEAVAVDMPELSIEDHLVEIESRWINEINSIYDKFDASGFDVRAYVKKVHAAMRDRPDFAAIVEEAIK